MLSRIRKIGPFLVRKLVGFVRGIGPFIRKRARYSLRTLLILMTASCLLLGTWTVYVAPYRAQASARQYLESNNLVKSIRIASAEGPEWQRWLVTTMIGGDAFARVITLEFLSGSATDDLLESHVSRLIGLRTLTADRGQITDRGLAALAGQHELESLSLRYARVSDAGLTHLSRLTNLEKLYLTGADVTDDGLDHFAKLAALREIFLRWTKVTPRGVAQLQDQLPECEFHVIPRAS